ncbi:MAG: hypothetical protein MI755_17200 [Sphingomonadales bacterium]|nr:hypothetical protein [Sphingomonadales bacterium]
MAYTYDLASRQTEVRFTDNTHIIDYTYDKAGRQTSVSDDRPSASARTISYQYDTASNRTRITHPDLAPTFFVAYDYDALNRVTFKNLPGSEPDVTTRFSRAGEVRIVSQSGLSNTYHYDAAGRVTSAVRSDGKTTAYAYDTAGNVTKLTYPGADNFFVTYAYDALGRLEEIRDKNTALLADYAYDLLSRRDGLELNANAASTAYAYDDASALDTLTHNLSGTTNDVTFTYLQNGVNQITQMTVSNPSAYLFAPAEDLSETVTVNAANQQTEVVRGPVLKFPLSYDTAGNLTSDGANLFGYDSQNRLVSAEMVGAGVDATYDYGPENRRFRKTVNASITSYAYDGGEAIAEYSGFGGAATLLRRYVYGPGIDEPVLKIEYNTGGAETGRLFYHADHQGSVIALSTTAGALSESFIYSPFGETSDSLSGNPYRYTGRRLDEETGLYYYRARYYSPIIGRFLSPDPIGDKLHRSRKPELGRPRTEYDVSAGLSVPPPVHQARKEDAMIRRLAVISLVGAAFTLTAAPVNAVSHLDKSVTVIQSVQYSRLCSFFQLEGVSEADPAVPGNAWSALPQDHPGYDELVAMIISAKAGGRKIDVFTDGNIACDIARVRMIRLY